MAVYKNRLSDIPTNANKSRFFMFGNRKREKKEKGTNKCRKNSLKTLIDFDPNEVNRYKKLFSNEGADCIP